jgi:hypothetical protein
MGEVIAFETKKAGVRMRSRPEGSARIVIFTGVWYETMDDLGEKKRRASGLGKTSVARTRRKYSAISHK